MASSQNVDLMGNVRALVEDALPARLPGARVAAERDEIIVAVPAAGPGCPWSRCCAAAWTSAG